jgi:3-oxoadipyl-CoA thiolase
LGVIRGIPVKRGNRHDRHARRFHLRCGANSDRALWGSLAHIRTDDLAAVPIRALVGRNPKVDWSALDEVVFGCANQASEDNRNVACMALLLAGIPDSVPGLTVNRLCASGLNAIGDAARAIRCGETEFAIAGGVESMTRAPLVMGKAQEAFQRGA